MHSALKRSLAALLSLLLPLAATAANAVPDRRIAVTIDDLPWQRIDTAPQSPQQMFDGQRRLLAQLRQTAVPVVGFVNEDKLEVDGRLDPARLALLRDWLDAGFELGNHTYAHLDLHAVGTAAYQQDILRGERVLRPLLAEYEQRPRWFRHPYLRVGRSAGQRAEIAAFLDHHGYRIAPVSVDNGEWVWAFAYARVQDQQPPSPAREATLQRLRRGYLPYMLNKLDYFERQSQALLGYALPQVWLLHANALNADCFAELIAATRRRGYRLIGLDEALRDPAYQRGAEGYDGRYGPSWLHRWSMAENRPKSFYAGEPVVPRWVLDLAGVDGE